jgi:hypothetical protein
MWAVFSKVKAAKVGFCSTLSLNTRRHCIGCEGEDFANPVLVARGEIDAENAAITPAHDIGLGDFQAVHQRHQT